jgi:hypothetical protein
MKTYKVYDFNNQIVKVEALSHEEARKKVFSKTKKTSKKKTSKRKNKSKVKSKLSDKE